MQICLYLDGGQQCEVGHDDLAVVNGAGGVDADVTGFHGGQR